MINSDFKNVPSLNTWNQVHLSGVDMGTRCYVNELMVYNPKEIRRAVILNQIPKLWIVFILLQKKYLRNMSCLKKKQPS